MGVKIRPDPIITLGQVEVQAQARKGTTPIMAATAMTQAMPVEPESTKSESGLRSYYASKIQELTFRVEEKQRNWERLRAQRNELNMRGTIQSLLFSRSSC